MVMGRVSAREGRWMSRRASEAQVDASDEVAGRNGSEQFGKIEAGI